MSRDNEDRGGIRVRGGHSDWSKEAEKRTDLAAKYGRRRTDTLSVSLKIELRKQLIDLCEELDVPVSQWVAAAIEEKMERENDD